GADTLGVGDEGVSGVAQIHEESFADLVQSIAQHLDGESLRGRARSKGKHSVGSQVIQSGNGCAVGGGVVDRDGLSAGGGEADSKQGVGSAAVAFGEAHVVDGQGGQGIIIVDGTDTLAIAERGVGGVGQVEQEGLVSLIEGVAEDFDGD